jgi:phosphoribosylaminoimidazole-succinocarboxamide synthase
MKRMGEIERSLLHQLNENPTMFDFNNPTIEGESKKIYTSADSEYCLIELKPTLYSYTYNRCGVILGTDRLRARFWRAIVNHLMRNGYGNTKLNYYGEIEWNGKFYIISKIIKRNNLEVVVKNYFTGTLTHSMYDYESYTLCDDTPLRKNMKFNEPFVRFDWRNPLHDKDGNRLKDECIPDGFAKLFFNNIKIVKNLVLDISREIDALLNMIGMTLIDICYTVSIDNILFSEISPDCCRIRSTTGESFDKDLWRGGDSEEKIIKVWTELVEKVETVVGN